MSIAPFDMQISQTPNTYLSFYLGEVIGKKSMKKTSFLVIRHK